MDYFGDLLHLIFTYALGIALAFALVVTDLRTVHTATVQSIVPYTGKSRVEVRVRVIRDGDLEDSSLRTPIAVQS